MILSALKCRQRLGTGGMLVSQIRRQAKTRQGSDVEPVGNWLRSRRETKDGRRDSGSI